MDEHDVDEAVSAMLDVLTPHAAADWSVQAGSVEWSCWSTAAHVAHDLLASAGQVAARPPWSCAGSSDESCSRPLKERFEAALTTAGFVDVRLVFETNDAAADDAFLDDLDQLFTSSPLPSRLDHRQRDEILAAGRFRGTPLAIPPPAPIAGATRS